jgi:hypothetical protein
MEVQQQQQLLLLMLGVMPISLQMLQLTKQPLCRPLQQQQK